MECSLVGKQNKVRELLKGEEITADTEHYKSQKWKGPVEHAVGSIAVTSASRTCTGHGPQAQTYPVEDICKKEKNEA